VERQFHIRRHLHNNPHLKMDMVTAEIRRYARKHEERLLHHKNVDAIRLLDNSEFNEGLN
jgi:hypothetical protein